ncbi:MAG: metal-dependent hydrolase [Leptospiraceae bacterium]|nr:metal-dependent hydrolase [Leptospiraceae bacterium]
MDSITQITLGAAVGEATLGRSVGRKAAVWGAVLGTLPDLDVLSSPFVDDYTQLSLHRGFSHSVLFAVLGGAGIAYGLKKLHSRYPVPFRKWFLFSFLALITHSLLDAFTVYGTQLLNPFSDYPVAWNSVFIIDPLYTIPLLSGLIISLILSRQSRVGQRFVLAGLIFSTAYLGWTQAAKSIIDDELEQSLQEQDIPYQKFMSNPTALNSVLWMGLAVDESHAYVALRGLLDDSPSIHWMKMPRNPDLIQAAVDQKDPYIERLLWFSRGYFRVERDSQGRLFFHDLRFGRSDGYLSDRGNFIFRFELLEDPENPGRLRGFRQFRPVVEGRASTLDLLWRRIKGDTSIQGRPQQRLYQPDPDFETENLEDAHTRSDDGPPASSRAEINRSFGS